MYREEANEGTGEERRIRERSSQLRTETRKRKQRMKKRNLM